MLLAMMLSFLIYPAPVTKFVAWTGYTSLRLIEQSILHIQLFYNLERN